MTGRHVRTMSAPMRADDPVAPGIKRSRSAYLVAAGLLIIVGAVAGSIVTLSTGVKDAKDSATLSSDETQQLREFLADRGRQRDAEREEFQRKLDQQTAAICAAVKTLQDAAQRPEGRAVLAKAAKELRCSALPTNATAAKPTAISPSPSKSTRVPAGTSTVPKAEGRSRPVPSVTPRPPPTKQPTKPTRAPPITTPPGRLLDPVTEPVCNVLGVCL